MQATDFDFNDYSGNVATTTALPHCQLISPKDWMLPFGFFIPMDKAGQCYFNLEAPGWELFTQYFSHDGEREEVEGFITKRSPHPTRKGEFLSDWVRLCVVRSTPLLVYGPNSFGTTAPLGQYFDRIGNPSDLGKKIVEGVKGYYPATRYLLYFLDPNNEPLHTSVLQFKSRGGFGGSFGTEVRSLVGRKNTPAEIDRAFFAAAKQRGIDLKGNCLDMTTKALSVFAFRIAVRQSTLPDGSQGAMCCYVAERLVPSCNESEIGSSKIISRRSGGEIKLTYADWQSLFIPKRSQFGQQIISDVETYANWGVEDKSQSSANVAGTVPHQASNSEPPLEDWETEEVPWDYVPPKTQLLDRDKTMKQTTQEMRRLGWDAEQGRRILIVRYGKDNRKLLSDEELLDFLGYLQSSNPVEEEIPY